MSTLNTDLTKAVVNTILGKEEKEHVYTFGSDWAGGTA